jgi:gamma-glutamyltranspeptidase / glutathione hydrolase
MHRSITALAVSLCVLAGSSTASARQPVHERYGMVVAQEPNAAEAGVDVLKVGGNAVDAAVTVAFTLAVTHPSAGNLGGGGFMLVRMADGRTTFFDFRERAPAKASRNMYLDASGEVTRDSVVGWRASGVPGTVRGLEAAHRKFGTRPWADLLAPSVRLAAQGFSLPYGTARSIQGASRLLAQFPESKRIFLNNGKFLEKDDMLRQPELAQVLDRIARQGSADFYEGETAQRLAAEMERNGGLITLDDLRGYSVAERVPLSLKYSGAFQVITAPPPSAGGIGMLEVLGILDGSGYQKSGAGSAAAIHFVAEAMRRYSADRSQYLGDPDFVKVPVKALLNPRYTAALRASIDPEHATPSARVRAGDVAAYESAETTHFSIVDAQGNAVALTYTLNNSYGSGVTVPGLGFLLNDEMDDFAARPGSPNMFGLVAGEVNAIAPRKRPLSSMTPTLVLRDGKLYMVLGAPGGSRIPSGVLQVLLNVVDFGMNIQDAIDAPRFHHQWMPDKLYVERGFSPDTVALLKARGHELESISNVAVVEGILVDGGWLQGGADGRGHGKAAGY